MKIILISADGSNSGKSTLAHKLSKDVVSLADGVRDFLDSFYPEIDWYNKTQEYKENVRIHSTGMTVREALISMGTGGRAKDENTWVDATIEKIRKMNVPVVCVDDVRFFNEVARFREEFENVEHVHILYSEAKVESGFDSLALACIADKLINRNPVSDLS